MVDLDKDFVAALLEESNPRAALKKVAERGIDSSDVQGEGNTAFEFVSDYISVYRKIPTAGLVEGKTGIVLPKPQGTFDFLLDEMYNRKLHGALTTGLQGPIGRLQAAEPKKALEELEELMLLMKQRQYSESSLRPLNSLGPEVLDFYRKIKAGETGVLTPWETMNDATLGFWPEEMILFVARSGVGKCLEKRTILENPRTGVLRSIEELYNDPSWGEVTTWSKEDGVHVRPIAAKHDTGYKTCLKFSLGTGRSVSVTPEHPFLTPDGWKRADSLKPGCTVGLPRKVPLPTEPVDLPSYEVDFIAIMLADGACTRGTPTFTKRDPDVLGLAETIAFRLGVELVESDQGRDRSFVRRKGEHNQAMELLRKHEMHGVMSKNKIIPDAVFRLPGPSLAQFLAVFWMCDGYEERGTACITLASEKLIRQLQHLFLRFGIQSSVSYKKAKCQTGEFDAWVLRIYSQCKETFLQEIPAFGAKMDRLRAAAPARNANVGFPRVSEDLMLQIKSEAGEQKGRWTDPERTAAKRRVADRLGRKEFSPKDLFNKHGDVYSVSLNSLRVYCEEFGCLDRYGWLFDSDVFWDVVEDIEDIGEQKIYDLTVEPTSCFVANDVIVHNTWLLLILAMHAWSIGKKVLMVSTEMSQLSIAIRWAALIAKVSHKELRHGRLGVFGEQQLEKKLQEVLDDKRIWIIGGNFDFRVPTFAAAVQEAKPDIAFLDGAYRMLGMGESSREKSANVYDEIKRTAMREKVPIGVSTQFNRDVKSSSGKALRLENISLTDVAGWNADAAVGLYQTEDMRRDRRMGFKFLKVREGEGQEFESEWDLDKMTFGEIVDSDSADDDLLDDAGDDIFDGLDPSDAPAKDDVPF